VLSSSLDAGIDRATLGATRAMLVTDLELSEKLPVTWDLRSAIEDAPRGQVPDLAGVFDERGAEGDNSLARARDQLLDTVTDLAAIPTVIVAGRSSHGRRVWTAQRRRVSAIGIGVLSIGAVGLLGAEVGRGAWSVGEFTAEDPCTAGPDPYPGDGLDASLQRIALSTLNGAACELHTTRERLVLSLDENSGYHDVRWDKDTLENALKVGAHRAIDDANDRDSIPGWAAAALGFVVDRAPIGWLVERIPIGD